MNADNVKTKRGALIAHLSNILIFIYSLNINLPLEQFLLAELHVPV